MPLFTLKKNMLLSSAIAATALLAGCGGGGGDDGAGPAANPCDSSHTGASEVVVNSFSNGTLKGHVSDGSTLKSVEILSRDNDTGNDADNNTQQATIGSDCKSFTITGVSTADALVLSGARAADNEPDYTITTKNNAGVVSENYYLARGAKLETVAAIQINENAFDIEENEADLLGWLSAVVSGYDLSAKLAESIFLPKDNGVLKANYQASALSVSPSIIQTLYTPILAQGVIASDYDYYMFITSVDFDAMHQPPVGGNNAALNMRVESVTPRDNSFDIIMKATFPGDTTVGTQLIMTKGSPASEKADVVANFVVTDLTLEVKVNVNNSGETSVLSFSLEEPLKDSSNKITSAPAFSLIPYIDPVTGISSNKYVSAVNGYVCINDSGIVCTTNSAVAEDSLFGQINTGADDIKSNVENTAEAAVGQQLRTLFDSISISNDPLPLTLEKDEFDNVTKQLTLTPADGFITSAAVDDAEPHGGFIGVGGSVKFDGMRSESDPTALGSYFEQYAPGASTIALGDFTPDPLNRSGVVLAVSEAAINQMLLGAFESNAIKSQPIETTVGDLGLSDGGGVSAADTVRIDVALSTPPYLNVGSDSDQVTATIGTTYLSVHLTSGGLSGTHVMDIVLSPKATMTYGIDALTGKPTAELPANMVEPNIHSIVIKDNLVQTAMDFKNITIADLKNDLKGVMQSELSNLIKTMADNILALDTTPTYKDLSTSDAMILNTLPKTVAVKLEAVGSDVDGKNLLLKGSLVVETTPATGLGVDKAIVNYIFCDYNDVTMQSQADYCPAPAIQ